MRTREKQRIFKRFMAGESVATICHFLAVKRKYPYCPAYEIESVLREGLAGKLDGKAKDENSDMR